MLLIWQVWWEIWNEEHQRFYYYNQASNETEWSLPEERESIVVVRWEEEDESVEQKATDSNETHVTASGAAGVTKETLGNDATIVPSPSDLSLKTMVQLAIDQCMQVDKVAQNLPDLI